MKAKSSKPIQTLSVEDAKRIAQAGWYLIQLKSGKKRYDYKLTARGPFSHQVAINWKRLFLILDKGVKNEKM